MNAISAVPMLFHLLFLPIVITTENPDFAMSTTFSKANAKFALDFYHLLSRAHLYENLLYSPLNLIAALGLLLYGSRCDTADEIEKVGIK